MPGISILFPSHAAPRRSIIGLEEEIELVGDAEIARTWNGRAVFLKPSWGYLYAVTLSNSGESVWTPGFDKLKRGSTFILYSQTWDSTVLMPGETTVSIDRMPVPGCVHARDANDESIAVPVSPFANQFTIEPRESPTTIAFRRQFQVMVAELTMGGTATGKSQSFSMRCEEFAPLP